MYDSAMRLAVSLAKQYVGATAPNPPVGAVGLDGQGNILSVQAHEKAGLGHAEALMIEDCARQGTLFKLHTLVVTLEPCNHHGKTPPCTEKILSTGIKRVVFACRDPNPQVAGGGCERLRAAGIEVIEFPHLKEECEELIEPFIHWSKTGFPWITIKTAIDPKGSMLPPEGKKTFTSEDSLKLAHELRKRSDAILTGSGTILADQPLFTVRHVPDHPGKTRWLVALDRRGRISADWIQEKQSQGFKAIRAKDYTEILEFLGSHGVLDLLVEAGPNLSSSILSGSLWNRHVIIQHTPAGKDRIEVRKNVHWNHPKPRNPPELRAQL